jgi:8-oxo-dGTP diphosphatase
MLLGLYRLPQSVLSIAKEVLRHVLRRPVTGVVVAGHTADGRWLLVRRADTGTWVLPGGTVEWGETLRQAYARELDEEAGVVASHFERVAGVFSRPDRDPRFHAITIVVRCAVEAPVRPPMNPLEIREARLFTTAELPEMAVMGAREMLECALGAGQGSDYFE